MAEIFKPRLSGDGWTKTKWFTKDYNSFVKSGVSIPNCTVHCCARWGEMFNHNPKEELWGNYDHIIGNAKYWYGDKSIGVNKDLKRGSQPKLGAIMCFDGNYGHVCIVEKIEGDKVTCSYQEKGGTSFSLATEEWKVGASYGKYGWGKFQGYIYPPVEYVAAPTKSIDEVAKEVIEGKWGNGEARKENLEAAGYDYSKVQDRVNELMDKKEKPKKSVSEVTKEVIDGKWGNGETRKKKLEAAGYDYDKIQAEVNKLMGDSTSSSIKKGDKVKVINPINYDNGKRFTLWYDTYDVIELDGKRAVIGRGKTVTAPINVGNLKRA